MARRADCRRASRRARIAALAVLAGLASLLLAAGPGGATPAGVNGLISYREYFDPDHTTGALFVVNPDGSNPRQITSPGDGNLDTNQNWAPNGQQIVYEHDTADGSSSLWVVDALGANAHQILACPGADNPNCAAVTNPSWSPDGQWIAFEMVSGPFDATGNPADDTIWAVHPNGKGLRQITHRIGGTSFDTSPQWSPDSSRIAFQRNQAPHFNAEVWTADSTTGADLVRVSPPGVRGGDHPDYSPDGRWIMFRSDNGVPGSAKLMIAHPDGTGLRILLDGSNRLSFFSSSFSPDGTAFTVGIAPGFGPDGNADVYVGHFDSHERVDSLTNITQTDAWESSPRWGTAPLIR